MCLSPKEAKSETAAQLMQEYAESNIFVDEVAWSPDHNTMALLMNEGLYLWKVGEESPSAVESVSKEPCRRYLAWSHDGKYVSFHFYASPQATLYVVEHSSLKIAAREHVLTTGFWSPDSNEMLIGLRDEPNESASLAILDMDSGDMRLLLEANNPWELYIPQGWESPGVVMYDYSKWVEGQPNISKAGLKLNTR